MKQNKFYFIGFAATLLFLWLFFVVAEDVVGRESIYNVDSRILSSLSTLRMPGLNRAMEAITVLGSWQAIFVGLALACIYLGIKKQWNLFWGFIVAVIGAQFLSTAIKNILHRSRPSFDSSLLYEKTYSFPSGHALVSLVFYGFLAYLIVTKVKSKAARTICVLLGVFLVLLIGFSRLYLGVHYPSDVLGGFLVGATWLSLIITSLEAKSNSKG